MLEKAWPRGSGRSDIARILSRLSLGFFWRIAPILSFKLGFSFLVEPELARMLLFDVGIAVVVPYRGYEVDLFGTFSSFDKYP